MTFRKSIRLAVRESNLTIGQRIRFNSALLIPGARNKIEQHILNKAIENSVVPDTLSLDTDSQVDIDWDKVKEFIKTYLPVLLKILFLIVL